MRKIFLHLLFVLVIIPITAVAQLTPNIEEIRFQPGDIILFISPHPIQRFINETATGGDITHIGLVVMGEDGKTLQIMHALGNDDGISWKFNPGNEFGVVIEPLYQALIKERDVYGQQLFLRPRKDPLLPAMSTALTEFAYRQKGKPYSSPKVVGPLIVNPFKNRPLITEPESYMCSELACTALVAIGALPATVNPPAITPFDFYNPQRLTMKVWKPKLGPKGGVMYYEKKMTPDLDQYGNKQTNWVGKTKMKQKTYNPIEANWRSPKPLILPDTFFNP